MLITIRELEDAPLDFAVELAVGELDLGSDSQGSDFRQVTGLKASGRAELLEEHQGKRQVLQDIRVHGQLATSLQMDCARCLEPVVYAVKREFDLLYRPELSAAQAAELEIKGAESEISYYGSDGLELNDALREQVLLDLPLRVLCRQDCKGLCPTCGCNRNTEACDCAAPVDVRWAGLKDLQSKLQD